MNIGQCCYWQDQTWHTVTVTVDSAVYSLSRRECAECDYQSPLSVDELLGWLA